ncbi:MAG: NAD-dependent epimerase/dehydratase family protein [Pirellulales bacterium]|nr:NAD-dependent epimerase/dehydratase family protein [Pirellulales bacterium]
MTVLVTGATGFVGNNVVRKLLAQNRLVRVFVRPSSDPRPLAGLDLDVRYGDIRDAHAVREAIAGCHAVVHAAALVRIGWSETEEFRMVNVGGTRHVAEAALSVRARMIHVSSIDALGAGESGARIDEESCCALGVSCPYPQTKRESDLVVLKMVHEGLDAIIVYPSFMLGPWDWKPSSGRMLLKIAKFHPFFAPRAGMDFTSVLDVADAIVTAIESGRSGERYILSGSHHRYLSAWRTMAQVCGVRRPFIAIGWLPLSIGGWYGDLMTRLTGQEGDVNSATVRMLWQPHFFSHEKATRQLDYHPRSLRTAAEEAWEWFQEYGYA